MFSLLAVMLMHNLYNHGQTTWRLSEEHFSQVSVLDKRLSRAAESIFKYILDNQYNRYEFPRMTVFCG